jgi:outer membrane protein TolC
VRAEFRWPRSPTLAASTPTSPSRSRALDQRPELREARLQVRQAEVDRRIKKSEYIPDVSVGFSYRSMRNFDNDVIPKNTASLGVVVRWEVFDWGRKKNQLAEKDRTIEQTKNSLREAESLVLIDVGDKFRKLQQTRQALVVAQQAGNGTEDTSRVSVNKSAIQAAALGPLQTQAALADADYQYQQACGLLDGQS